MIEKIIILSLIITAIWETMQDGMIFSCLRTVLGNLCDKLHAPILKKPLYECLVCMGGIYSLLLYPLLYGIDFEILPTMCGVIGLNAVISSMLCRNV